MSGPAIQRSQIAQCSPKAAEVNDDEGAGDALARGLGGGGEDLAGEGLAVDDDGLPEALEAHVFLQLVEVDAAKVVEI